MNKKDNQRTRLTKMLLKNSLIKLLYKKPIYQISVSELCSTAELNRSTFYKYYGNVQDLMKEIEDETLCRSLKCMQQMGAAGAYNSEQFLYRLLLDIQENKEVYWLLTNSSNDHNFTKKAVKSIVDLFKELMNAAGLESEMSDYVFSYIASACFSIIRNWICGPMTETPAEISKLIYSISVSVLEHMDILPEKKQI